MKILNKIYDINLSKSKRQKSKTKINKIKKSKTKKQKEILL